MSACPVLEELRQLLDGGLTPRDEDAIGEHVDQCPVCRHRLEDALRQRAAVRNRGVLPGDEGGRSARPAAPEAAADSVTTQSVGDETPRGGSLRLPGISWFSNLARSVWQESLAQGNTPPTLENYEILRELGTGGAARVFAARDRRLGRTVAVKLPAAGQYATTQERQRLLKEAELTALLQHPHVVELFETGETGGQPYLVLELMAGGSLADRLAAGPWREREAAELVMTLALAVDAAHRAGIVHRDLKPANVLFTAEGTPKIADFGIARRGGAGLTRTGIVMGTIDYMAPEQAQGRVAGPEADIYALGGILYALLTGSPPFTHEDAGYKLYEICHVDPSRPRREGLPVARDLETICLKALEKEPARRFESATQMAEELQRFLDGQPLRIRPPSLLQRTGRFVQRNRALTAVSLAALFIIFAAAAYGQYREALSNQRAILQAQSRDELQILALLTDGHLRLSHRESGRVEEVWGKTLPQIELLREALGRMEESSDLDLAIRTLRVAAGGVDDAQLAETVMLKMLADRNRGWPAAPHPAGHAAVIAGATRPYCIMRDEPFDALQELDDPSPNARVAYSPTGRWIVYVSEEGEVSLWDELATREMCRWPRVGSEPSRTVALGFEREDVGPTGGGIRILSEDGVVRRLAVRAWAPEVGSFEPLVDEAREFRCEHLPGRPQCGDFSANGAVLAVGDEFGNIDVYNCEQEGILTQTIVTGRRSVTILACAPDGKMVVSYLSSGAVLIHDTDSQDLLHRISVPERVPIAMFFGPQENRLFISVPGDGTTAWNLVTGKVHLRFNEGLVGCSRDGLRFIGSWADRVTFWNWHPADVIRGCLAHHNTVMNVAWSSDSQRFATLDASNELCIWTRHGRLVWKTRLVPGDFPPDNCGLALDGEGAMVCYACRRGGREGRGEAQLIDVATGEKLPPIPLGRGAFFRVAFESHSRKFVVLFEESENPGRGDLRTVKCEISLDGTAGEPAVLRRPRDGDRLFIDQKLTNGGEYYVWTGPREPRAAFRTELWDVRKGRLLESVSHAKYETTVGEPGAQVDTDARDLWVTCERDERSDAPSANDPGRTIRQGFRIPRAVSPNRKWRVEDSLAKVEFPASCLMLHRYNDEIPLIKLLFESDQNWYHSGSVCFSPDSQYLIWGRPSGEVRLLNLDRLEAVLDEAPR